MSRNTEKVNHNIPKKQKSAFTNEKGFNFEKVKTKQD